MKKMTLYIIIVVLIAIVVSGGTFAFFAFTTSSSDNAINTKSNKFEINYSGDTDVSGAINPSNSKESGISGTLNISAGSSSVLPQATVYLTIGTITDTLATEGFIWEVYGVKNGTQVYSNTGTFDGIEANDEVILVNNYQLSEDNTVFTFYFWLDGSEVGNEVIGASFSGKIGARSENFTATS